VIFKGYLPFHGEQGLNDYVDRVLRMRRKDFLPWLKQHSDLNGTAGCRHWSYDTSGQGCEGGISAVMGHAVQGTCWTIGTSSTNERARTVIVSRPEGLLRQRCKTQRNSSGRECGSFFRG